MSIRRFIVPGLITTAVGVTATPAHASLVAADAEMGSSGTSTSAATPSGPSACAGQSFAREFAAWGDARWYTLSPGADFESGSSAIAVGGAAFTGSQNTHRSGTRSVRIPTGGSVLTEPVCVTREYPSMRFFARAITPGANLRIDVVYESRISAAGGTIPAGAAWGPTKSVNLATGQFTDADGDGQTMIRFQISTTGGTVKVDDVYVDPHFKP